MASKFIFIGIGVFGALLLIAGGVMYAIVPGFIEEQVKEQVQLKEGSTIYDNWKKLALPLFMNFYFFNTTNADDVLRSGAKPQLEEIGPYAYTEWREKVGIAEGNETHTLKYRQIKKYIFQKEKSCPGCDVTDIITVPNIPAIAIVTIAQYRKTTEQNQLKFILGKIPLYKSVSVRELIFDGYKDPFVKTVQDQTGQQILPNDTFGILYGTNNTDDGEYMLHTGEGDAAKFAQLISWNGMNKLPYWPEGTSCTMINGTDGFQYAPFVTKDTVLRMFLPEIYRSAFTVFEKETEFSGISSYRFTPTVDMFGDPSVTPENACFNPYDFLPSGLHNISSARDGAPIFFSLPHFYMGDPTLLLSVNGLNPSKEKHQTVVDVEPTTGTVINAARKVQVNIRMKTPKFLLGEKIDMGQQPEMVYPVVWIDEGAKIDQHNADILIGSLYTPQRIANGLMYALMAVGSILIIVGGALFIFKKKPIEESMSQQELTKTQL